MKIGILTYHRSVNYGAYLQAMALCSRLNMEDDIEAEIIDFRMKCDDHHYKYNFGTRNPNKILHRLILNHTFTKSVKLLPRSEKYILSDDYNKLSDIYYKKYDMIIAGSDEIWRTDTFRGFPNPYWLPGDLGCKKVTYATSAAKCSFVDLPAEKQEVLRSLLADFDYIGVRDAKTYSELKKLHYVDDKLYMCCDPSFVYDFKASPEKGKEILVKKCGINAKWKTVLFMGHNEKLVQKLKEKYDGKINIVSLYVYNKGITNTPWLSPLEWVDVISAADFMVTEFFHGACFSIINSTPFFAVETRISSNEMSKLYNLLEPFNMLERYTLQYSEDTLDQILQSIDKAFNGEKCNFKEIVDIQRKGFDDFIHVIREIR